MSNTRQGPRLRIVASCLGCVHIKLVPSTAYRSSFNYCGHQDAIEPPTIENAHTDSTPQWCPLLKDALHSFMSGNPQHKVNERT